MPKLREESPRKPTQNILKTGLYSMILNQFQPTKQIGLYGYHHPNYFSLLVPDLGVSLHFCDYIFVWKVFDFQLNFLFIRKEGHLDLWIDYTFSSI